MLYALQIILGSLMLLTMIGYVGYMIYKWLRYDMSEIIEGCQLIVDGVKFLLAGAFCIAYTFILACLFIGLPVALMIAIIL